MMSRSSLREPGQAVNFRGYGRFLGEAGPDRLQGIENEPFKTPLTPAIGKFPQGSRPPPDDRGPQRDVARLVLRQKGGAARAHPGPGGGSWAAATLFGRGFEMPFLMISLLHQPPVGQVIEVRT